MAKKKIIYIVLAVVIIGCLVLYALLSNGQKYQEIIYKIEYPSDTLFSEVQLADYVKKNCPTVIGKSIDSITRNNFEKTVEKYPYLEDAQVVNNGGTLIIKAQQVKIVAKIQNINNEQFLLAESGKLVPLSKNTAGRIVVASGVIRNKYTEQTKVQAPHDSLLTKTNAPKYHNALFTVWKIACFIENDPFWKAQIGQIYVNEKQEIELVPTVGEHVVLFGRVELRENMEKAIENKFANLKTLYTQGFIMTGWDKYQTVNLKYGKEIPCEKRKN